MEVDGADGELSPSNLAPSFDLDDLRSIEAVRRPFEGRSKGARRELEGSSKGARKLSESHPKATASW